jgi:hypothetical protein
MNFETVLSLTNLAKVGGRWLGLQCKISQTALELLLPLELTLLATMSLANRNISLWPSQYSMTSQRPTERLHVVVFGGTR